MQNNALSSYIPHMSTGQQLSSSANSTMMEVIQIVTAHTADVIMHMMQILSDKYSHPIEEMLECIRTNPQFHSINLHPMLTKEFFESTLPAPKKGGRKPKAIPIPVSAAVTPVPISVPVSNPLSPKRVIKIIKKTTAPIINPDLNLSSDAALVTALASPSSIKSDCTTTSADSQDSVIINIPPPSIIVHDGTEEVAIKPTEVPKIKKNIKIVKKITSESVALESIIPESAALESIPLVGDSKEIKPHTY